MEASEVEAFEEADSEAEVEVFEGVEDLADLQDLLEELVLTGPYLDLPEDEITITMADDMVADMAGVGDGVIIPGIIVHGHVGGGDRTTDLGTIRQCISVVASYY